VSPARRRLAVEHLQRVFGVSQRWACQLVGQHRSTQRHQPAEPDRDRALREKLRRLSRAGSVALVVGRQGGETPGMRLAHRSRRSIPPCSAFAGFRFPSDVIVLGPVALCRLGAC
jgi:hypothetical protein